MEHWHEARTRSEAQRRAIARSPRALVALSAVSNVCFVVLAVLMLSRDDFDVPWWAATLAVVVVTTSSTAVAAARQALRDADWLDAADRKVWNGWFRVLGPLAVPLVAREIARHRRRAASS